MPSLPVFRPQPRRHPLAHAALLASLLGTAVPAAQAQQPAAVPASSVRHAYDIPAGPLAPALRQVASQAGVVLSFTPAQTDGKSTSGLRGSHTVEDALSQVLKGSDLQAVPAAAGGFALRAVPTVAGLAEAGDSAHTLAPVTVTANQLGEITEGSGSYTPGAIATATRLVLTPRETPQSISVVTRQEMNDFGLNSIEQVMAFTPGVSTVVNDSERIEFYARGFAIQDFQYDGIPVTRDGAYSAGQTLSDTAIYDRVEVLKGANGLLTGTGNPGATINLIRKKPTRQFQGEASLGVGSWQNYRGQLDFSGPLNAAGSVRGRVVASYQDKHSHLDRYQRKTSVFYGTLEADLTPSTLLTVGADHQNSDPRGNTWGGIPIYDSTGQFNAQPRSFNNGASWSSWKQYTRTAFATLEHYFDNDWSAKLQLSQQVNGYDAQVAAAANGNPNPLDGSGVTLNGPTWYDGSTTTRTLDFHAHGPFSLLGRRHELVLGGSASNRTWGSDMYVRTSDYDLSNNNRRVPNYYAWDGNIPFPAWRYFLRSDTTIHERGLYATARWNLRDDLKLITGSRVLSYRDGKTSKSGVVVPYLGAVYDLNPQLSAYASYTTIYRPQSVQTKEGATLDPLEGKNKELGLKGSFLGGRLNASAAYFQLDQNNYPEYTSDTTPSGGSAARAIQGVKTKGYELEVSGQLAPRWQVHAGFSHKVSRQQGAKVSTLTPENLLTLHAAYKPAALPGLTLGAGARWQDKSWGKVTNVLTGQAADAVADAYWLLDVSARYEFDRNLSVQLNVRNLLDKKYLSIFSTYSTYTWGEPRSVNLSMNYRF